ncbi:MAG: Anp1-domain-containing protein [Benniella sp.]|nr:MAG: Anp1-domain-containing protein [Benniella sp.]
MIYRNTTLRVLDLDSIHTYPLIGDTDSPALLTGRVLILTPLVSAASYLDKYFENLSKLNYPKELLSLGFLVSTTPKGPPDPTLLALQTHIAPMISAYRRITVIQQSSEPRNYTHEGRHAYEAQESRRKILARCRNALLSTALFDESWVLWLDVDVVEYPPNTLLHLMRLDKDIIAPNCFRIETGWFSSSRVPYDRNNWSETKESLASQRVLDEGNVLFEGYGTDHPTYRQSMADMDQNSHQVVPLDGVGGTFTLIKAMVHRVGVNFPVEPIDHEIETEGLAKSAKRQGFGVYGAPYLIVRHA